MEINEMTFEQALNELERTVAKLESETLTLDEALALYKRGVQLFEHCRDRLQEAEGWVKQVVATAGGYELQPLTTREEWEARGGAPPAETGEAEEIDVGEDDDSEDDDDEP
jgi:exodeoxyribonuclease VII small subunit